MAIQLQIKNRIFTSVALVSVLIFFGIYTLIYSNIFKENVQLGKVPKSELSIIDESENVTKVLGDSESNGVKKTDPTELRMLAAANATQNKVLGVKSSFGVAVSDYSNKNQELGNLNKQLNNKISTVSIFKQFGNIYNNSISLQDLTYIKSNNIKLLIAWEPWNPDEGLKQSKDYLAQIPQGLHDQYIKSFAKSIISFQNPVSIRFGHEMNGNWYPWGNRPAEYIRAYQHIVNIFNSEGVNNVEWVWAINALSVPLKPVEYIESFYPGNEYVDIIGIDGVNFGSTNKESSWQSFKDIFFPPYSYISKKYAKPIIIAETASSENGGDKAVWVDQMFASLTNTFPKIEEIIWFNINKETDWRINSSNSSMDTFKKYF